MTRHTLIFEYVSGDIAASVYEVEDQRYTLAWHDHIVNSWEETFSSLSVAMMRLALLIACEESAWEDGFRLSPSDHENAAKEFIAQNL